MRGKQSLEKTGKKFIKGFENYSITPAGKVFSHLSGKYLKPSDNGNGYKYVSLRRDGVSYQRAVHRLVAETLLGENTLPVNHIDGDKSNNNISNLEFVTPSENTRHGFANGLMKTCPIVLEKGGKGYWFPTQKSAAVFLKVSKSAINAVCVGKNKTVKQFKLI